MSTLRRHLHEQNRLSWNAATRAHNGDKRDQAKFLRKQVPGPGGTFHLPPDTPQLPFMFGLVAEKR